MASIYSFKNIKSIHSAQELVDIVLSKTQRKTPTEVHPKYQIMRIREFYMRKVKFAASCFEEKLQEIIVTFPKLNDIHPFFADLLNVLYDKDHYKIALGQVNITKSIIERLAKDYVKMLKFADAMYRCKQLKIAALGRMCTAVKKLKASLDFLEEIRKHLRRLPGIDPFAPSVLLFGFPNVGKSSFINKITKANVEISAMPFSTQNLFVGHTEHHNVTIQVIDSPGVLNRALEQRNTIEMQSITALAHLKTMVIFIVDVSETCGYALKEQFKLFEDLKPLFTKKPAILALNKVDITPVSSLDGEAVQFINQFKETNPNVEVVELSALNEELVEKVKVSACEKLLQHRVSNRKAADTLKTDEDYYRGVRVIQPKNRNNVNRGPHIPESVRLERQNQEKQQRETLKDLQEEHGGAGVFNFPWNEHFMLADDAWKYDNVPEIINGMNIADYIDPDIERKLLELEREQDEMFNMNDEEMIDEAEMMEDNALKQVRSQKTLNQLQSRLTKKNRVSKNKIALSSLKEKLAAKGKSSDKVNKKLESAPRSRSLRANQSGMDLESTDGIIDRKRTNASLRAEWNKPEQFVESKRRKIQKKAMMKGQAGDADRHIYTKMPRHLFSGKMGLGTRDRR